MQTHNWKITYTADLFDSADGSLRIIKADSTDHPQGPITVATINLRAVAPHVEHAEESAALMAAAPQLFDALNNLQSAPNDPRNHRAALDALKAAQIRPTPDNEQD